MSFYITQATLEIVGGISWWMFSKTSNLIYTRIYPKKKLIASATRLESESVEIELKQIEVYMKELISEVKNQNEEIKLLKQLIVRF